MKKTSNVLTEFMLPVATMLGKNIYLGGFDGRDKDELNFWKYSTSTNQDIDSHKVTHTSFFEDRDILENLGKLFKESLKIDTTKTQIELLPLNDFSALSGAAELIFKGWDKEAIPFSQRKKSIISSFFERFFE